MTSFFAALAYVLALELVCGQRMSFKWGCLALQMDCAVSGVTPRVHRVIISWDVPPLWFFVSSPYSPLRGLYHFILCWCGSSTPIPLFSWPLNFPSNVISSVKIVFEWNTLPVLYQALVIIPIANTHQIMLTNQSATLMHSHRDLEERDKQPITCNKQCLEYSLGFLGYMHWSKF